MVRPTVLTIVCAVRGSPGLIVHGAIETLWNSVLRENIGIEEYLQKISTRWSYRTSCETMAFNTYARHEAAVSCWVPTIIGCLSVASIRARLRVITLALAEGKVLVAHVAARSCGSVDRAAKLLRTDITADGRWWSSFVVRCS